LEVLQIPEQIYGGGGKNSSSFMDILDDMAIIESTLTAGRSM
jgi:hypothetical protein